MKRETVKRHIFLSNTRMVIVTLLFLLALNLLIGGIYAETIEQEFRTSLEQIAENAALEQLLQDYTLHRNSFLILLLADGILCIVTLILVGRYFTGKLAAQIMTPLNALEEGIERIRRNDLTKEISYSGEAEFEDVCNAFNEMQASILAEQAKNRSYEKARTEMIAGISHDLKTPLTAIKGSIKGVLDGVAATPEQQQKFLETAYRRTGEMDVLLNQLFYLSKLETGNMPFAIQRAELSGFIEGYVKEKQMLFSEKSVEITADTKGITGWAMADREQFSRIFDNLLENSRKYAEVSPLKIRITLDRTEKEYRICFADNGAGVSPEKLPRIFEEFYRADESRNKKDGNGLGLYIVRRLTEAMGGSVGAENGDGFRVWIVLPTAETDSVCRNGEEDGR